MHCRRPPVLKLPHCHQSQLDQWVKSNKLSQNTMKDILQFQQGLERKANAICETIRSLLNVIAPAAAGAVEVGGTAG